MLLKYECISEIDIITHLSLSIVHSSPPKQASINMYTYFLSLNVLYNL